VLAVVAPEVAGAAGVDVAGVVAGVDVDVELLLLPQAASATAARPTVPMRAALRRIVILVSH
jgi:hypothetical protein